MDKLDRYRQLVQEFLHEYASYTPSYGQVETEGIFDPAHEHYQLMSVGWNGQQRIGGCLLHVDIRGDKVWIQHDGTEEGLANRLVSAGVPKGDIVLAFQSPFKRQFTEYACG